MALYSAWKRSAWVVVVSRVFFFGELLWGEGGGKEREREGIEWRA